ncbi:MAG TPA: DNA polymerase ligase N-terminal domain-containing protein [Blastocatellia bacterium]|nr:DNA polymerase ligase N-terminal domain-containing protein [Blastocatellia bacterium]
MSLKRYRDKRDFRNTPEPSGKPRPESEQHRFVVHEHHASRLHFDLRLEMGSTLKSWAVPKGPSLNPAEKRLAVEVEDHPIEYLEFKGEIPRGEYGAGRVYIWDSGTYQPKSPDVLTQWTEGHIEFVMHGHVLKGGFALVEMKRRRSAGKRSWLLIKIKDRYADPQWRLVLREGSRQRRGSGRKANATAKSAKR